MPQRLDCLCAGIIVADSVCQPIAKMPRPGTLITTARVEFTIGGCAANAAVDMARLGLKVGVSGRVGDDLFGREVRDRLIGSSVDVGGLVLSRTAPSSTTFVLNVQGEDRRFIHCVGANNEYDGLQVTSDDIQNSRVLYVGGFGLLEALKPEHVVRMFRIARDAHVTTVLDVCLPEGGDQLLPWVREVLPWTDFFFPNNDESTQLLHGKADPFIQVQQFRDLGARTVVITCGGDGAVLASPSQQLKVGVYPVEPVDSTGTGDAFLSGFVYGMLQQSTLDRCLTLGAAMGASCVRSMGATTGVFQEEELLNFVADHRLPVDTW